MNSKKTAEKGGNLHELKYQYCFCSTSLSIMTKFFVCDAHSKLIDGINSICFCWSSSMPGEAISLI